MSHYSKNKKHKHICKRYEAGMDDALEEWLSNDGICKACLYEIATGKMQIDAPVELVRSTYNFARSSISPREDAKHVLGGRG